MTILISILSFLVAIAILVGIHEFGHFWVARKLGVKIIRFAIGFGKPIWTYKSKDKDQTEYVLAAIPMGGYVKMLDEREGDVPEEEKHRAFNTQPVWKRFLVVLAGPMFNFFFAIAAFAAIQMIGVDATKPYLGNMQENTAAAKAGFEERDLVTAINGVETNSIEELSLTLLNEYLKDPKLDIQVTTDSGSNAVRNLDLTNVELLADETDYFSKTGLGFWQPPHATMIASIVPDKPAAKAGLIADDEVISIDGNPVKSTEYFASYINQHPNKPVEISIIRQGINKTLSITPELFDIEGQQRVIIGVGLARKFDDETRNKLFFLQKSGFFDSLKAGVIKTKDMSVITLKFMGRLITGDASIKNISGPITIANYAGKSALIGFTAFLSLLGLVSISLGVLNLLPIPMLDGGHLMYYIIEVIKGSPVSERIEAAGMRIGMGLVGVLMIVAFYNDIGRIIN